jgi:hypothetical protein
MLRRNAPALARHMIVGIIWLILLIDRPSGTVAEA